MQAKASGRSRKFTLKIAAAVSAGALIAGGSLSVAMAEPGDDAEALGQFLGTDLLNLDLADLAYAYASDPGGPPESTDPFNLAVLQALGLDIDLIGDGLLQLPLLTDGTGPGLLNLGEVGVLNSYAATASPTSAIAASGLVSDDGTIAISEDADPGDFGNATLNLTDLLDQLGVAAVTDDLIDQASLEIGALASRAVKEAGNDPTADYRVADLKVNLHSPAVATIADTLRATLTTATGTLTSSLEALVGEDGLINGVIGAIPDVNLLGVASVSLGEPTIAITPPDLTGLVDDLLGGPGAVVVSDDGAVTIDLVNGTVTVDLAALVNPGGPGLNGLDPNTSVLTTDTIQLITAGVTNALGKVVGNLTASLDTAIQSTGITLDVGLSVVALPAVGGLPLVDAPITISGTLAEFAAGEGEVDTSGITLLPGAPTCLGVQLGGTCLGVDINDVVGAVLDTVVDTLAPAILAGVATPISDVLTATGPTITASLDLVIAGVLELLSPAIDGLLANIVTVVINEQPTEAPISAPGGDLGDGSFTVRALSVTLLPNLVGSNLVKLDLASSTVHALDVLPPAIDSLSPNSGPELGGTVVTITGTGFTDATGVTFDGNPGTDFTVVDDTTITVTTPAGTPGLVDVVVQSPNGDSEPGEFTYIAAPVPPTVTGLTPDSGPETGGTVVTITGTGFTGATGVTFDGNPGTEFTVVDDTTITVTTPPGTAGPVDVVVESPNGDSEPGEFTYIAAPVPPTVTGLTPSSGPEAGGTVVTITGTGFTDATGVTFDGNPGTDFTVVSDTEITVTTPAGTAGPVDVVVQSPNGDSEPGEFTYIAAPVPPSIDSITPDSGPEAGGTVVTITGSGFTDATGVTFDGNPGTEFTVVDDTTITVTTPAGTPGLVDVVVQSPNGDSEPGEFTYIAAPVVEGLTPTSGPEAGGTVVTITGSGFTGATGVTFDGNAGTEFTVVDDNTITVTTPAGTPGLVDVVVESPNGDSEPGEFTYIAAPVPPVVEGLTPDSGPETGGTVVTITGSGFTGATGVTFDGNAGTEFTVVDDNTITVTTPAGTPGLVDVVVESPNGDSEPGEFTYIAAPVVEGLTPDSGPEAGGTVVTITGTGFTGATGVTFDGNAGTEFTVVDDTTITVTTPPGTAGPVDVVVESPNGDSEPGEFTYIAAPVPPSIEGLTPSSGPEAGGTVVTITGSGFTGATGVTFDGNPGMDFTVVDDTTITVTTPPGTAGPVDVVVQSPNGDSEPGEFTYIAAPVPPSIEGLTPTSGPEAGGTVVTITGTGFTDATGVTFDGNAGTDFTVVDDTTITVTTPPGTAGLVDVVVESPNGDSEPGEFTYIAAPVPPTVTGLTPDSGPEAGGTVVTITGTGFTDATGVTFDGNAGTEFTVVDDTTITVTTPAGTPGLVDVVVESPNGDSEPGEFTYIAAPVPPVIEGLTPTSGPEAGGTVVTITGTGFTGAIGVTFDGNPGTEFTVVDDTTITVTTPAGTPGPVDVVVESPNGDSEPGEFTYIAAPVVEGLTPDSGPETGGTVVTITGTGFTGATGVTFDGNPGTEFTVVDDNTITVTTPAGTPGPVDVVVESPNGDSEPGEFTYIAAPVPPVIEGLTPSSGPEAGGTVVTITGTGFTDATGVTFDGNPGTDFTVVSDTEITVTTPAGTAGPVDVVVQSPNGDSEPGEFTYIAAPVPPSIDSITPDSGPEAGGTVVTITGSGFTDATGVTFDGNPGTEFTVVDDTTITVTTPAGTPGLVDVVVQSPNGDSEPGEFTYIAAPVVEGLTPTSGPEAGGTVVTITGTGFTDATGVTFDGNAGTEFTVVDDNTITVTTPAGTPGPVDVVVQSPNGDSEPGEFTYIAAPVPPTVTGLTPSSGPEAGGTVVTITGSGFTDATGVTFDGNAGTEFTVVSDTEITVTTPAGTPGPVDVVVESPNGDSEPGEFTYIAAPVPPSIDSITPDSGPETGGTVVTITGTGFTDATGVTFDGNPGTEFTVVDDNTITVTTPAGTPGPVDVVVQSPNGDSEPGEFTYIAAPVPPTVTGLTPSSGPEAGGTVVTITGTGFTGATGVTFDGNPGMDFTVVDDTTITVTTPPGTAGPVDVVVQSPNGDSEPGEFTYVEVVEPAAPVIDSITPDNGPVAGGTVVTITGSGFTDATGVTFDGTPGVDFTVVDDHTITVTTPPGTAGPVEVIVQSPNGDSEPGEFTYLAPVPPTTSVDEVDPGTGPEAGGNIVTISGMCFADGTRVYFGGAEGAIISISADGTSMQVRVPAGTGTVDVRVVGVNGCGEDTLADGYRYLPASAALPGTGVETGLAVGISALVMAMGALLLLIRRRRGAATD